MWITTIGGIGTPRDTDGHSEALAAYVRAEYGEANVAWFLADVRRATRKPRAVKSTTGTRATDRAEGTTA